jgi:hypothetical protein
MPGRNSENVYIFAMMKRITFTPVFEVSSLLGTQQSRSLPPHLKMETDPVSETLCSLVFRILDDERSPKTQ